MDSPSFSFTTPEQRRQRFLDDADAANSEDWHFRDGPSPITAPRFQGEEQDENKAEELQDQNWSFAHSHFRRRNRLETRLEELQKDVASLTLKLRTNGSRNTSLDASSFLYTPKQDVEEVKSYKTPRTVDKQRKSAKEQVTVTGAKNSVVKTLRELHNVTTERDQLKFELEGTKRALSIAEKKYQNVEKSKKAYEKLKAHCDSLQESLDLSERIRVRQKKLLQQLQLQRKEKEAVKPRTTKTGEKAPVKKRPLSAGNRDKRTLLRSTATPPKQTQQDTSAGGFTHTNYDILDSLVASSHQDEEDAGLSTHEQAPSEPTAASRSRTPRSVLKPTTPTTKQFRPDFDSLLQVDAPQFSTRRPSRITTTRRPSQTQVQQREAMRQAARWARSRGSAVDISTSTTQLPTRRTPTGRPKNSFLAPTQASLRRLHDLPRRGNHERPPFVV
ncbi:hypothetical protein PC129_g1451 [Phytophthora cactorum]|uniref:Uncharacterized protein n=2 Tax=Phytophthora cactorum TaxID=29920 RepID=A0A329T6K9_9STRA|nr:hypothetical protein Pcac1_g10969 [Phytophthora cactorum]KAG2847816.1 hypothetical protein PC111_g668 [Phytophthora cactorum]KAG2849836.1 hypothetical protein PC112_g15 [Phytophthora cactorum]KAG2869329.1 hypothetical protein PC113_g267 [Phytophthora cactorum]KAG2936395.1 hypothetical protein PC114_g309 [Phytophthora cactorum]